MVGEKTGMITPLIGQRIHRRFGIALDRSQQKSSCSGGASWQFVKHSLEIKQVPKEKVVLRFHRLQDAR